MAAPVGVTRSPAMPSSRVAKPSSSSAVAGVGTGIRPCMVCTIPDPKGNGDTLQLAGSSVAISQAAATMSAMESAAPTS